MSDVNPADRQFVEKNRELRMDPNLSDLFNQVRSEFHLARYRFAAQQIKNRQVTKVLDLACGLGYGSALIAKEAGAQVTGCDFSADAIQYAQNNYAQENLAFRVGTALWTGLADKQFNAVVSFETIEHLVAAPLGLDEFCRVLADDGIFIGSVPNAWGTTAHHITDFNYAKLVKLLGIFFESFEIYAQNSGDMSRFENRAQPAGIEKIADAQDARVSTAECLLFVCQGKRPRQELIRPQTEQAQAGLSIVFQQHVVVQRQDLFYKFVFASTRIADQKELFESIMAAMYDSSLSVVDRMVFGVPLGYLALEAAQFHSARAEVFKILSSNILAVAEQYGESYWDAERSYTTEERVMLRWLISAAFVCARLAGAVNNFFEFHRFTKLILRLPYYKFLPQLGTRYLETALREAYQLVDEAPQHKNQAIQILRAALDQFFISLKYVERSEDFFLGTAMRELLEVFLYAERICVTLRDWGATEERSGALAETDYPSHVTLSKRLARVENDYLMVYQSIRKFLAEDNQLYRELLQDVYRCGGGQDLSLEGEVRRLSMQSAGFRALAETKWGAVKQLEQDLAKSRALNEEYGAELNALRQAQQIAAPQMAELAAIKASVTFRLMNKIRAQEALIKPLRWFVKKPIVLALKLRAFFK